MPTSYFSVEHHSVLQKCDQHTNATLLLVMINTTCCCTSIVLQHSNILINGASETNDFSVICMLKLGAWIIIYSGGEDSEGSQGSQPLPTITPRKQRKGV